MSFIPEPFNSTWHCIQHLLETCCLITVIFSHCRHCVSFFMRSVSFNPQNTSASAFITFSFNLGSERFSNLLTADRSKSQLLLLLPGHFSHVRLCATPQTAAHQAPPSLGFSRQEQCNGQPFPSPGDLPNPGIKPRSPALQVTSLPFEPPGKPEYCLGPNPVS